MMFTVEASDHLLILPEVILEQEMSNLAPESPGWRKIAHQYLQVRLCHGTQTTKSTHTLISGSISY